MPGVDAPGVDAPGADVPAIDAPRADAGGGTEVIGMVGPYAEMHLGDHPVYPIDMAEGDYGVHYNGGGVATGTSAHHPEGWWDGGAFSRMTPPTVDGLERGISVNDVWRGATIPIQEINLRFEWRGSSRLGSLWDGCKFPQTSEPPARKGLFCHDGRVRRLLLAVCLVACSDPPSPALSALPDPAASPAATPSEPTPTATPPTAPTTPPVAAPPAVVSPEALAEVARLVREARALEHGGDHRGALARFDDALRLVPNQPRVLCEAGFIAHRAGDTALAARRIDTALSVFGPPRDISDRLRVPLAMCLYNRGLVAEADDDPRSAVSAFESSLALRPNATVESALARARTAAAALPSAWAREATTTGETVGGLPSDGYVVVTADLAAYRRALAAGLRGTSFDGAWRAAAETQLVSHPIVPEGPRAALVQTVITVEEPLTETRLVVSWPNEDVYVSQELGLGWSDDGIEEGSRITVRSVAATWVSDVLRVDVGVTDSHHSRSWYTGDDDLPCMDEQVRTEERDFVVFCRDGDLCVSFATRIETAGETSVICDEDQPPGPAHLARAVITASGEGVVVSQVRDPDDHLELEAGSLDWDEVMVDGHSMELVELALDGHDR